MDTTKLTPEQKEGLIQIMNSLSVPKKTILKNLGIPVASFYRWKRNFQKDGLQGLKPKPKRIIIKRNDEQIKSAIFEILHSPPKNYNINRTTWKFKDLKLILKEKKNILVSKNLIGTILKVAGYKWRKAKKVLTSNDPDYREKMSYPVACCGVVHY